MEKTHIKSSNETCWNDIIPRVVFLKEDFLFIIFWMTFFYFKWKLSWILNLIGLNNWPSSRRRVSFIIITHSFFYEVFFSHNLITKKNFPIKVVNRRISHPKLSLKGTFLLQSYFKTKTTANPDNESLSSLAVGQSNLSHITLSHMFWCVDGKRYAFIINLAIFHCTHSN